MHANHEDWIDTRLGTMHLEPSRSPLNECEIMEDSSSALWSPYLFYCGLVLAAVGLALVSIAAYLEFRSMERSRPTAGSPVSNVLALPQRTKPITAVIDRAMIMVSRKMKPVASRLVNALLVLLASVIRMAFWLLSSTVEVVVKMPSAPAQPPAISRSPCLDGFLSDRQEGKHPLDDTAFDTQTESEEDTDSESCSTPSKDAILDRDDDKRRYWHSYNLGD